MELFIRIKDGAPFEHPIVGENFRQAFSDVDTENLPAEFAKFVRIAPPTLGVYEKNQTVSYQLVGEVYTDVFTCEQMTVQEIAFKQQQAKDFWANNNGFASWTFNEQTCAYEAPTPMPTDTTNVYVWNEETITWIEKNNA